MRKPGSPSTAKKKGASDKPNGHAARVDRSRAAILEASAAMIMERGPAGFTIDALVERTGIAKTTVYRHWPTRRDLMVSVFSRMTHPAGTPDTGTLRGDLHEFFMGGVRAMKDNRWDQRMQSLPGIIELSQRDPDLTAVGAEVLKSAIRSVTPMLDRARSRGELRTDVSVEAMAHVLFGAIFLHRALDYDLSEGYVAEVIHAVLDGITAPSAAQITGSLRPAPAERGPRSAKMGNRPSKRRR